MSKKTIFFDSYCGYAMSAIVEDGKISEFNFEKKGNLSITGNIYKGRVESVLPGMNAAFINCGLERNCYLSADDVLYDNSRYDGENGELPPFPALNVGDEIAVQIVKPPVGTKGAKVTASFSFVGKHFIYMPLTPFVGVSRKIADEELRKNLVYTAGRLKKEGEGIVLRTAAPYAKRKQLEAEIDYLRNIYAGVNNALASAAVGDLIYTDLELPVRVMRDTLSYDIEKIIVGNAKLEKLIRDLVALYPPSNRRPVLLHDTGRDMLSDYGISEQIFELASEKVRLDNGAHLIIERTEALTVVDVNTGKYTGDDSLEQTVYYTNILAAREIARQVKLRNIGGIVVVDFIDMQNPVHRSAIVQELERALKKDSAKCCVAPMSQFGLVEFTRKRTGGNPLAQLTRPCRHCKNGKVKTARYALFGLRAQLMKMYSEGKKEIRVDINADLLEELLGWQEYIDELKTLLAEAKIFAVPHAKYSEEQISIYPLQQPLHPKSVKII